ncbi:hypothetical protein GA707_16910 [Nostocoides sp. F2B08]|uniref:hypothetical protein n=1 Tax=Nostocoides sp. F2B08 TaxID=2653936 RepID=UPI001262CF64|nr:hypothetical protein [Tetrasphaera sp. F2B08]KAB7741893.1 hypothetical protein GA707_16910 [Tetrasphaera sp. F2B08]
MSSPTRRETVRPEQFRGRDAIGQDRTAATRHWAALASLVAGVIHLGVAPTQSDQGALVVPFVIALGCFQLAFAGLVWRRATVPVALTGIVVNLGAALAHVAIRATGPPAASTPLNVDGRPLPGHGVHPTDGAVPGDLLAISAGLAVVWLLVTLLPPRLRRRTVDVLLVAGAGVWLLRLGLAFG